MPAGRPANSYVPALDGLRAVAITLVFITHMITPIRFGGQLGVDIFFVLSGYLITSILLTEYSRDGTIRRGRFSVRRLIRLYPSLVAAVVAVFIPGLIFAPSALKYLVENVLALTYSTPLALQVNDGAAWALRHTWSLGIEELFYVAWPTALLIALRRGIAGRRLGVAALCFGILLLAVSVFLHFAGVSGSLFFRAGGLFVGCALAAFFASRPGVRVPSFFGWAGLVLIAGGVVLDTVARQEPVAVLIAVFGALGVVAHVVSEQNGKLSLFLGLLPLAYVGRISYELYLFHYPVMIILAWAFGTEPVAVALAAAPISILLAVITNKLLAPRVDKWKRSADVKFA